MQLVKFQSKNQITIPKEITAQFCLRKGDVLKCEMSEAYIMLTPVDLEERYSKSALSAIDRIVEDGKGKGYSLKTDQDIEMYIEKMKKEGV